MPNERDNGEDPFDWLDYFENAKPEPEVWYIASEDREDGFECLVLYRGYWFHVKWDKDRNIWSLPFANRIDGEEWPMSPLPVHPGTTSNFYEWKVEAT
jgi:hypothetical protein